MRFSSVAMQWLATVAILSTVLPSVNAIPLLGGRFETTTDVQAILDLALDAAEMKETTDLQRKSDIYQSGISAENQFSFQTLSLNAQQSMGHSPMFNLFRHAFLVLGKATEGETEGDFDNHPISQYADTLVNDLFELRVDSIETEAALVLNVWMAAVHELFEVFDACKTENSAKGLANLDRAAAYWIGEGQETGDNEGGHLLYNLAENAGERFGQDNGEVEVNTQLVQNFVGLQADLNANKCSTEQGKTEVRRKIKKSISWMTVPLVQNLIHHTINLSAEDGSSYVALYALATIPRVASCNPAAYDKELHLDVLRQLTPDQAVSSIASIQEALSCLDVTCAQVGSYLDGTLPQCEEKTFVKAAGYSPALPNAYTKSYLDRDIKEIDVFLKFGANGAAEDWYNYGWNSDDFTLKDLATNQVVPPTSETSYIDLFENYYGIASFAHQFFLNVVQLVPPYNTASDGQIRQLATGILKYAVIFMTSVSSLQYAVTQCASNKSLSLQYWDTGALLYVGSMEGEDANGSLFGGEFLYSTAKELCMDFGTCTDDPNAPSENHIAAVNKVLMVDLSQGSTSIDARFCDVAETLLKTKILPLMIVPLLQGTILYASYNSQLDVGTTDPSLAIGSAFALAVLPIINEASPDSAGTIRQQMSFELTDKPVAGGFPVFADSMRMALQGMDTSCVDIGELVDDPIQGNMCRNPEDPGDQPVQPPASEPTPATTPLPGSTANQTPEGIAFGRYVFQDPDVADGDGSFSLDVRDMFEAADVAEARSIYTGGMHAVTKGFSGSKGLTSLSSLSREASRYMMEDPMFNVFRYALYNDEDLDDGSGADFLYADDVVVEALDGGRDRKLAAEGAVVMNVWMMIVHQLYEARRLCRGGANPVPLIDSAVALWIGKGQAEAKYTSGWMLYSIAQSAAQFYGLEEGEAQVNTDLMVLFNEAQATGNFCADSDDAQVEMYHLTNELVRTLSKPLILTLLFHLVSGSQNMVELYAVSVVPQAFLCSDVLGRSLQNDLFSGYSEDALTDGMIDNLATFLRCQRFTPADLAHTGVADEKLVALLESLSARLSFGTQDGEHLLMAGYEPYKTVTETARLDLDILEITMMMRARAYSAASDIYHLGHNARKQDNPSEYQTLEKVVNSKRTERDPIFDQYREYYGEELPFKNIMANALQKTGEFATASRGELAEIVFTTLQVMVSFLGVTDRLHTAELYCHKNQTHFTKSSWDEGVALFVGSIESRANSGDSRNDGTMLYTFGNEVCEAFGTCEPAGESKLNEEMLSYFAAGRDTGKHLHCEHLNRIRSGSLASRFATVLVQGTLAFAIKNMNVATRDSETLATAHILAKTVLPLVNTVNSTSAATISDALGDFTTILTGQPIDDIVEAFAYALRGMNIDCGNVGVPAAVPTFSLCLATNPGDGNVPDEAPVSDTVTDLGDGLYLTSTYVQDRADMAIDISDMEEAVGTNSYELAKYIYRDGKNSRVYDENGKFVSLRSLKSFSVEETKEMFDEPLFNIFMYALQDGEGKFMSRDVRLYADSIVEDAFNNINDENNLIPVEAAVVLNLWMHIAHILNKTLKDCKNSQITDDDGVHSLDIAVAYWIGDGQEAGSGEVGHSLYALAERMGDLFDMGRGGQSRTNTNILRVFNEARHEISLPSACSSNPASYLRLSRMVNKITSLMAVPLIQALIQSLRVNDRDRVKLYGHAVIPLSAGCSPEVFEYLKDKVLGMNYDILEVEDIVTRIRKMYPCLDLSCSDIGVHEDEMTSEELVCKDNNFRTALAGYEPSSDVREYARLDLDMRQLDILLQMKAYEAAENLYLSGKHVEGSNGASLSLAHLATASERAIVPGFDTFTRYYDGTFVTPSNYADEIIRSALPHNSDANLYGVNAELNDAQRRVIVLNTVQVMVLYFAGLQSLYQAVSECQNTASVRTSGYTEAWDRGAALLIGSLEGTDVKGTDHGYMYFDLAQEHCAEFGTCEDSGSGSQINTEIGALLYSGRGALAANGCRELRRSADEISKLLLVPVIQGSLSTAIRLTGGKDSSGVVRSEAYVYSRAILPLVNRVDRDAARVIETQLGFPGTSSTRGTAAQVFAAFAKVYPAMEIDCTMIGEAHGSNACSGVVYYQGLEMIWIIVGSAVILAVICIFTLFCRRRQEKKLPENNPLFFAADNGELNHSMDLLEKAFAAHSRPRAVGKPSETVPFTQDMYTDASASEEGDFDEATALTFHSEQPDII